MKNKYLIITLIALLLLSILSTAMWVRSAQKSAIAQTGYDQNITALGDSVRVYKGKHMEAIFEKSAFITARKQLGKYSEKLEQQIKSLKDKAITAAIINTLIVHDTVEVGVVRDSSWAADSTINAKFSWAINNVYDQNNYRHLSGTYMVSVDAHRNITSSNFTIDKDEIGLGLVTGITESKGGLLEVFATSKYPNFTPTSMEGALIDPRESKVIKQHFPRKWFALTATAGYGALYDFQAGRLSHGVGVMGGVSVILVQW